MQKKCSDEVIELLLIEGCSDAEISKRTGLSARGVTNRVNRMYLSYGITAGVKRVQLTVLLFRRWLTRCESKRKRESCLQATAKAC
jgi:DNA-binding NarL/FixJ family response regulator